MPGSQGGKVPSTLPLSHWVSSLSRICFPFFCVQPLLLSCFPFPLCLHHFVSLFLSCFYSSPSASLLGIQIQHPAHRNNQPTPSCTTQILR